MRVTTELKWGANQEKDLAGYRVTWGNGAAAYTITLDKETTSLTLSLEVTCSPVKIYVQSYDVAGNVSIKRLVQTVYVS